MVSQVATALLTSALTGESPNIDASSLIKSAVLSGVLSYTSNFTQLSDYGFDKGAYTTKIAQAGVNAGVKTAITGGNFKDNLISEAGSVAFNAVGHDLYNKSEYKDILPPKSIVQGLVGGALAELQGGDFASGAISTATSHVVSEYMINSVLENFDPKNPPFDINDKEAAQKYTEQIKTQIKAVSSLVGGTVALATNKDLSQKDLDIAQSLSNNVQENNALFLAVPIVLALAAYANAPDVGEKTQTGLPSSMLFQPLDNAVFVYDITKELLDGGVPTEAILIALAHKLHIPESTAKKIVDDVKVGKTLSKEGKIADNAIDYTNKPKQKVNTADVGDTVMTPTMDTNQQYFTKLNGGNYRNNETGEIWSKSYTQHSGGVEWKVGLGKDTTPTSSKKITVDANTGKIIKADR